MKHAGAASLALLEPLLEQLRALPTLTEKKPGIFYRKSKPCLHFHEDPGGLFADVRLQGTEFERFPVNTEAEQQALLRRVADRRAG